MSVSTRMLVVVSCHSPSFSACSFEARSLSDPEAEIISVRLEVSNPQLNSEFLTFM